MCVCHQLFAVKNVSFEFMCSMIQALIRDGYNNGTNKCTHEPRNSFIRYYYCLLLVLTANGFIPSGSVLQCKTGQYNTVQYVTIQYNTIQYNKTSQRITYNTQGNPLYVKLQKIKNIHPIKSQKCVEPEVDG